MRITKNKIDLISIQKNKLYQEIDTAYFLFYKVNYLFTLKCPLYIFPSGRVNKYQ
jgi:hypothetical protein